MTRSIFPLRYASRAVALTLLAGLCWAAFGPRSSHARLQPQKAPQLSRWTTSNDGDDIFVLYRNERGETTCRPATKAERDQINSRQLGGPTRVIYPGAPRDRDENAMKALESDAGLPHVCLNSMERHPIALLVTGSASVTL